MRSGEDAALVCIDPSDPRILWLGPTVDQVLIGTDGRLAITQRGTPLQVRLATNALCQGTNNDTGEPFAIDLFPAVLNAARIQGVDVAPNWAEWWPALLAGPWSARAARTAATA